MRWKIIFIYIILREPLIVFASVIPLAILYYTHIVIKVVNIIGLSTMQ